MIGGSAIATSAVADAPGRFALIAQLDAAAGSYSLTGQGVELIKGYVLDAENGSLTITGNAATFEYINFLLQAAAGSYAINGQDAGFLFNRVLAAENGSYTLTGYAADLLRGLLRSKLARISVSRSGTSATVTLENFESGDLWNIYRAPVDSNGTGTYTKRKDSHSTATYNDSGLTSGNRYKWRAAITYTSFGEQQKSRPRFSNPD